MLKAKSKKQKAKKLVHKSLGEAIISFLLWSFRFQLLPHGFFPDRLKFRSFFPAGEGGFIGQFVADFK
jgi:hypothetical protein